MKWSEAFVIAFIWLISGIVAYLGYPGVFIATTIITVLLFVGIY